MTFLVPTSSKGSTTKIRRTKLAPVVLFAFSRPSLTQRALEALSKTGVEKLYVFVDGPRNCEDRHSVEKVAELVRTIAFCETKIVLRHRNLGLARSLHSGISEVFQKNDSVIVLEDDILVEPIFVRVMSNLLAKYEKNPKVLSVSGYAPPIDVPPTYPFSFYFSRRVSTWGWATWRDRWQGLSLLTPQTVDHKKMSRMMVDIAPDQAFEWPSRLKSAWSLSFLLRAYERNMLTAWPTRSLLRNIGLDDSGTHCNINSSRLAAKSFWRDGDELVLPNDVVASELALKAFNGLLTPKTTYGRRLRLTKMYLTGKAPGPFERRLLKQVRQFRSLL